MNKLSIFGVVFLLLISCNKIGNKSQQVNSSSQNNPNSIAKDISQIKEEVKESSHSLSLQELELLLNQNLISQEEFLELKKIAQK